MYRRRTAKRRTTMKYENIYYTNNSNSNQTLDVFMPDDINGRIPVLIYIHGGGLE